MSLSVDMALNAIAHYPMSLIPANTHLSLRERQNAAVRSEIVQSGIKRFLDCGFDETTTDEIADDVGVSRRTVFRHFPIKEDIVLSWPLASVGQLRAAVAACPANEPPLVCMQSTIVKHVSAQAERHPGALLIAKLIEKTPRLRSRSHELTDAWESALTEGLIDRNPDQAAQAPLISVVAVATARLGARRWLAADGAITLTASINHAFDELALVGL